MAVVGDHGAAGDVADELVALVDGHAGPHDALVQQGDGHDPPGQVRQIGEVPVHHPLEDLVLLLQGLPADKGALLLREADGEFGQGHGKNGDLLPLGVQAHLVAVQGQAGLQAAGVAGPQAGGLRPQLDEPVPQPGCLGSLNVNLVADGFAGVAGLSHPDGAALELEGVQGVLHGLGNGLAAGEDLENLLGLGALDGDGGPVPGDDGHLGVVALDLFVQVGQVLVRVGGVDHQQVPVLLEAVEVGVVHRAARFIGDDGVLGLIEVQGHDVAGENVLEEGDHLRALHQNAAHVGHVEETACVAGVEVLGDNVGGVLDGHLPSAEIHHGGPCGHVDVVELGALEFTHRFICPPLKFSRGLL